MRVCMRACVCGPKRQLDGWVRMSLFNSAAAAYIVY